MCRKSQKRAIEARAGGGAVGHGRERPAPASSALVEAARRQPGIGSPTELGVPTLAALARRTIRVRAGSLMLSDASDILADNDGGAEADGGVDIVARRVIVGPGSRIASDAFRG